MDDDPGPHPNRPEEPNVQDYINDQPKRKKRCIPEKKIAEGMVDLVGQGLVTQTGATAAAQIYSDALEPIFQAHDLDVYLPRTFYTLKKNASVIEDRGIMHSICYKCCHVFSHTDQDEEVCPRPSCAVPRQISLEPRCLLFDIRAQIRRQMNSPYTAKCHHYAAEFRRPKDGDIWDGDVLREWTVEKRLSTIAILGCTDGVVVQNTTSTSFTPYIGQWLNHHPTHRNSYGGLLKFGIFPQGIKDYSAVFKAVFDLANDQGLLDGVAVWDAHSRVTRTMDLEFVFDHEDSQGLRKVLGSCGVGSKIGGCPWCDAEGYAVYPGNAHCYYPVAVRHLPLGDPLREEFAQEFRKDERFVELANLPPPNLTTNAQAIAAGERVEQKLTAAVDELYSAVSPFYNYFGTPMVDRTTADPHHAIGKSIEDLLCLVFTVQSHQMCFSQKQQEFEKGDLLRWVEMDRYHWRASPPCRNRLHLLLQTLLKPSTWARIKHLVDKPITSKLAEVLQVGGDIGKYLIGLMDITEEYKIKFVALLDCFDRMQTKTPMSDDESTECQEKLVRTMAWLEKSLPLYWCTTVRLLLLHIIPRMGTFGLLWAHGMLTAERNHVKIKGSVRSTQNALKSVAENLQLLDTAKSRSKALCNPETPPSGLSYSSDGRIVVGWKKPKQPRYRDLHLRTYEHLLDLWAMRLDHGKDFDYYQSLMRKYRCAKDDNHSLTPEKWVTTQQRISTKGRKFMTSSRSVMLLSKAHLGLAEFRPERKVTGKKSKSFNACVAVEYNETSDAGVTTQKVCYGVIERMFVSSCGVDGVSDDVVIQCRWYAIVGTDAVTGLRRVAYRRNWDEDCCVSFFNQAAPSNLTLWPADPFVKTVERGKVKYTIKKVAWIDESFVFNPIQRPSPV